MELSETVGSYVLPVTEERKPETQDPHAERSKGGISRKNVVAASAFNLRDARGEIQRIEESSGTKKPKSAAASIYARFTQEARHVILYSQEEARLLNHGYVGTEHLLLGLLAGAEGGGVALRALNILGVSLEQTRLAVKMMIGTGSKEFGGQVPFTPRAKKVLELALREVSSMGHEYIGTEHLLLALLREGEGIAAQILQRIGLELETVRTLVSEIISAGSHLEERLRPARKSKPQSKAKPVKSKATSRPVKPKSAPAKRKAKAPAAKPKTKAVSSKKGKPTSRKKKES
ncbi:MAG TPA: Clp protease N-terminal domain-containing protein [Actinomycetota bacterium]|nr:Clp protease N-terminal domain-containing protein [Actinomycetota bacterium]